MGDTAQATRQSSYGAAARPGPEAWDLVQREEEREMYPLLCGHLLCGHRSGCAAVVMAGAGSVDRGLGRRHDQ